ncbi:carbohydrate sulfotransferase 11-like isoform X2 [Eriocheir sinensis]|uniref:carbohydrate sulfotransferase 11-like isoform X2 n=1 Tax=Eriocheir sinensis TaxID=95602 RepID=UPI0021C753B9|nr:carbohydrate sulfotransferase 11-like isoform X2 [Eriocheir sinensis]
MKRSFLRPRLLTISLTIIALFPCYFIVKKEFSPSAKSWILVNVSSISNPFIRDESKITGKIITESKDEGRRGVTLSEVSDELREDSDTQGQGAMLGGGVPEGMSETPLTGWPLLQQRANVVQRVCRRFRVQHAPARSDDGPRATTVSGNYTEYVSLKAFQMIRSAFSLACVINKVASTSLMMSFLRVEGVPQYITGSPHMLADRFLKPQTERELAFAQDHFFKFLLVRHPFARLLSAYRDKVEQANHWSLKELREHIFQTLGKTPQSYKSHQKVPPNSGGAVPTFSDFLQYILVTNYTGEGFDSHWAPYWHLCSPCAIQYDAVAKLETADVDLKKIGIHEAAIPWFNHMSPSNTSSTTINPYYRALDPALIARVYRYYFLDFEMFQYSVLDVLREGGHCQAHDCSDMVSYFRQ